MICPRYTLRTLAILVSLICVYVGTWQATKTQGVKHVLAAHRDAATVDSCRSYFPFVVQLSVTKDRVIVVDSARQNAQIHGQANFTFFVGFSRGQELKRYYLWLFGPTIELPFESEW